MQNALGVYHGYAAVDQNEVPDLGTEWRVDWRGANQGRGNTARMIIRCPNDRVEQYSRGTITSAMLAGYDTDGAADHNWPPNSRPNIPEFRHFIEILHEQGYLNTPAFMPITQNWQHNIANRHGEVLPSVRPNSQFRQHNTADGTGNIWLSPCEFYFCMIALCTADGSLIDETNFRIRDFRQTLGDSHGTWAATYDYDIPMPARYPMGSEDGRPFPGRPVVPPPPPPNPPPFVPPPPGPPPRKEGQKFPLGNLTVVWNVTDLLRNVTLAETSPYST
jgi:hypothetical protein